MRCSPRASQAAPEAVRPVHLRWMLAAMFAASLVVTSAANAWTTQGTLVSAQPGSHDHPRLVADGFGGAYIAWQHTDVISHVRLQHLDALGAPATGWGAGGSEIAPPGESRTPASAGTDGAGGAIVAWRGTARWLARRVQSEGASAAGWADSGNVLLGVQTGPHANDYVSTFSVDGAGGAWFAVHNDTQFCPDICYNSSSETLHHVANNGTIDANSAVVVSSNQLYSAGTVLGHGSGTSALLEAFDGYALSGSLQDYSAPQWPPVWS